MKKILIMFNPNSGKGNAEHFANALKNEFNKVGETDITLFKSLTIDSLAEYFKKVKKEDIIFDCCVFLGGDGTFGIATDLMLKAGLNFPVAIFPLGTVNDFSRQLKIKRNPKNCVNIIMRDRKIPSDVALVNDSYVVNVAGGGYFTHSTNTYSRRAKKVFGKLAYYGKGFLNVFGMKAQKLRITIDDEVKEENLFFYLILNSKSAGGFAKIGSSAEISDGYFDIVGIRKANIFKLFILFIQMLFGTHAKNKNVLYKKAKYFKVELAGDDINPNFIKSDTDGNVGPNLPLEVKVVKRKITIYHNLSDRELAGKEIEKEDYESEILKNGEPVIKEKEKNKKEN